MTEQAIMDSLPRRNQKKAQAVRLAYLVTHPIQYQAPLLRRIALEPDIDLTVFFGSDFSVHGYNDVGFGGADVRWDIPLLEGYKHEFLPVLRDLRRITRLSPLNHGIFTRLRGRPGEPGFDALWLHGYANANALHAMLAARSLGIPVLVRAESRLPGGERSHWRRSLQQLYLHLLGELVSGVLPIGQLNAEFWQHHFGDAIPQFPMPYAVDNGYFQQRSHDAAPNRSSLQKKLNLDPSRPVILFASKLQKRKCCADLLGAYRLLSPAPGIDPHPYLVIVGDGEQRSALEQTAQETGFQSIRFCGFRNQSELPGFFDLCSVFVLPSRHEPWGLIVNEVMNAARPVIVSDDAGCQPDLITPGVEGEVFPVGNRDALAHALRRILATPKTAQQMGQRALERIQSWNFEEDVCGLRRALAAVTKKIAP
ncbi:MAG: glycosyltransferase family 4 protein [Acidobacteria bacterium]|nr:glycosyltransferase family 4 protein [Acidobacteriota bacterium]